MSACWSWRGTAPQAHLPCGCVAEHAVMGAREDVQAPGQGCGFTMVGWIGEAGLEAGQAKAGAGERDGLVGQDTG